MVSCYRILSLLAVLGLAVNSGLARAENYLDVDVGVAYSNVSASEPSPIDGDFEDGSVGYHLGVGAYRSNDGSRWIYGVKLEVQDVVGSNLLAVRAIDVGYTITTNMVVNGFLGAARFDLATPAYGYRVGLGGHYWLSDRWAVAAEATYGDSLARDKLLPGEDPANSPDVFFDIVQLNMYVKFKF